MRLQITSPTIRQSWLSSVLAGVIIIALLLPIVQADAVTDRRIVFKPGQTRARVRGKLTRKTVERYFVVVARAGQHMRVVIKPITAKLITAGEVIYPSGQQDGGPGGVIFDAVLTESGNYRIRVTQRQERVTGFFFLDIELR